MKSPSLALLARPSSSDCSFSSLPSHGLRRHGYIRGDTMRLHSFLFLGLLALLLTLTPSRSVSASENVVGSPQVIKYRALDNLSSATSIDQAEEALRLFFSSYHMSVIITDSNKDLYKKTWATWKQVSIEDLTKLKSYGAALIYEWSKYPQAFVEVTRVQGVVLVNKLVVSGQTRAAMPDVANDVMFYDISYGGGDYARETIHHEFNHLFIYNLSGSFAPNGPAWRSLNPPNFRYGRGGASCYLPENTCLAGPHPISGFVSGYATSAIEEDTAETFAYLMESNDYRLLKSWSMKDSYLAAKVENYKTFLCNISSSMCGNYFNTIN